ncbi:MAG: glutamate racemase [Thaumarchaeota archaeon]|nr:glutamate racemase [Nitrososphaerota archaeon]MBT3743364.1 glutamate racemase [Nitrososphaerota archaeon]MBT4175856.1 glutamate racemase [Nitrososphaerota archaeon]MBT4675052.1 glutamate racemase [Nitrososphaerota archaeon]MBT4972986.1 glutamate racemase [Nitrososphaerota archaeon]
MKIVVFDSGLGSLSIIKAIQKKTKSDIIYLADKKNFPYGKKTKSQLYKIVSDTIKKISERFDPDVIVLASNTPSLLFRENLPNNVITVLPPLKKILKPGNVAILTTEIVVKSKELDNYISEFNNLKNISKINCSELVELVESGKFLTHEKDCVKTILKVLKDEFKENKIKVATLSSTHLPFLLPFMKKYFRRVEFLDPADDVAIKISKLKGPKSTKNSLSIYTTKSPKALQRNLKSMGISNKVNLFS